MKQTKSLLTLFLTAALALANIASSWGAVLPLVSSQPIESGKYAIKNAYSNKFIANNDADKKLTTTQSDGVWNITKNTDGSYYMQSPKNNRYLGVTTDATPKVTSASETALCVWLVTPEQVITLSSPATIPDFAYVVGTASSAKVFNNGTSLALTTLSSKKTDLKTAWVFTRIYDYWYKISAVANDNQMGSAYVSFDGESFSASEVTKSFEDTKSTTAYFKAVSEEGYKFDGWFTDPTCTTSANPTTGNYTDEQITVAVSSTSTTESAPTITTLYAKFSPAAQKSDFAYTWNCGDVIYGDESYSNLVTVHGENPPSYTLTVADETYLTNVVRENNIITSFETKDYVGADKTITFRIACNITGCRFN